MRLTVLGDVYEPGSTFKMLTASAAIDCGATSPQEGFYCSGKITVDGSTVRCWGAPHGTGKRWRGRWKTPATRFLPSWRFDWGSRTVLPISARVSGWAAERAFVSLDGEASGILIGQNRVIERWISARIGFGQSVAATPIEMITAACAVVNGGRLMKPYLVEAI